MNNEQKEFRLKCGWSWSFQNSILINSHVHKLQKEEQIYVLFLMLEIQILVFLPHVWNLGTSLLAHAWNINLWIFFLIYRFQIQVLLFMLEILIQVFLLMLENWVQIFCLVMFGIQGPLGCQVMIPKSRAFF